jgi:hypothetical protein
VAPLALTNIQYSKPLFAKEDDKNPKEGAAVGREDKLPPNCCLLHPPWIYPHSQVHKGGHHHPFSHLQECILSPQSKLQDLPRVVGTRHKNTKRISKSKLFPPPTLKSPPFSSSPQEPIPPQGFANIFFSLLLPCRSPAGLERSLQKVVGLPPELSAHCPVPLSPPTSLSL